MSADLNALAAEVDVLNVAGRFIADPRRAQVSQAATLAFALTIEALWDICLEARQLVNAVEAAMPLTDADADAAEHLVLQAGHVRDLIAAVTGGEGPTISKGDA